MHEHVAFLIKTKLRKYEAEVAYTFVEHRPKDLVIYVEIYCQVFQQPVRGQA